MNYKNMIDILDKLMQENYQEYIKAIISIELNVDNEVLLDNIYQKYMNDDIDLLSDALYEYYLTS